MYHLYVETDYDFGLIYKGKEYFGCSCNIKIESVDELFQIEVTGPFGTPHVHHGRDQEFLLAIEEIEKNPDKFYNSIGGNRGVRWMREETYKMAHPSCDFNME